MDRLKKMEERILERIVKDRQGKQDKEEEENGQGGYTITINNGN